MIKGKEEVMIKGKEEVMIKGKEVMIKGKEVMIKGKEDLKLEEERREFDCKKLINDFLSKLRFLDTGWEIKRYSL